MSKVLRLALAAIVAVHGCTAHKDHAQARQGVIGYGITMYDPPCAFACIDSFKRYPLQCEDGDGAPATSKCRAQNDPFLRSVALCFHDKCTKIANSTLQKVWETDLVGRLKHQPMPKTSYQAALAAVLESPPTSVANSTSVLDRPSLTDDDKWKSNFNGNHGFELMETTSQTYAIVLMTTTVGIPIALSILRFLPLPTTFVSKFFASVIDAPLYGGYHAVPVLGVGIVPTRGQALFIVYIWSMNIILCVAGYKIQRPMAWYETISQQLVAYIANRAGVMAFVNLAIAVLFSSRNNLLLYFTSWSHSTFLLVHRWIGVICMLQACIHSLMYLGFYLDPLNVDQIKAEMKLPYWIWGSVATISFVLIMPLSVLPLRKRLYSVFLASHIVLALLAMIGCFLHIYYRYEWQWGYQTWVVIAFSFWGFDRLFARLLKIMRNGVTRAYIHRIDDEYIQVTVPGVEAKGHVYLYFPAMSWRFWENNPFSVAGIALGTGISESDVSLMQPYDSSGYTSESSVAKKEAGVTTVRGIEQLSVGGNRPGLAVLIRSENGITQKLRKYADVKEGIPIMVESSYGPHMSLLEAPQGHPTIAFPNIICIAGGVGITGVMPHVNHESSLPGTRKLYWGVRSRPLVNAMRDVVRSVRKGETLEMWNGFEVVTSVEKRLDIKALLTEELDGACGGTTVAVCGPLSMADDVRNCVAELCRQGANVRLVEDTFCW